MILGIVGQIYGTQTNSRSAPSSLYFIRTPAKSLQENPGSIQTVLFLVRIKALGLTVPLAENRVYILHYSGPCYVLRGTTVLVLVPCLFL